MKPKNYGSNGIQKNAATLAIIAVFAVAAFSCQGEKSPKESAAGSATATATAVAGSAAKGSGYVPEPEAELRLKAVAREGDAAIIVFKHTHPGYMEAFGYDTLVYRFSSMGEGALSEITVSSREVGGERVRMRVSVSYAGDSLLLSGFSQAPEVREFKIDKQARTAISGAGGRISLSADRKALEFARSVLPANRSYGDSYQLGIANLESAYSVDGSIEERGALLPSHVDYPGATKVYRAKKLEDKEGAEDAFVAFWNSGEALRCVIDGVEPVGELYCEGVSSLLSGPRVLENLATLDTLFEGDRSMRAVFAYAMVLGLSGSK